jgi:hypothetical protein
LKLVGRYGGEKRAICHGLVESAHAPRSGSGSARRLVGVLSSRGLWLGHSGEWLWSARMSACPYCGWFAVWFGGYVSCFPFVFGSR